MKVAAIDLGSNSIHIIIARVGMQGVIEVIDRDKDMVRLGAGTLTQGVLSEEAMNRGLQALANFRRLAERHGVDAIVAVATSAVREARNGGSFIERVRHETGIEVKVVSGREEARLIYLGARDALDLRGQRVAILDIGGGSVEFMLGDAAGLVVAESLRLGVLRLLERFGGVEPIPRETRASLEGYVQGQAEQVVDELKRHGFHRVVGTSGTLTTMVALSHALAHGSLPDKLHGVTVDREQLALATRKVLATSRADRAKLPGVDPRRVDTIAMGALLTQTLLRMLGADGLTACDRALREGLVVDYIDTHRPDIRLTDAEPDVRRRSVLHLAGRCNALTPHVRHLARLCGQLFDGLASHHGLGATDRELLEFSALLIDIGYLIESEDHHKHAWYLIQNCHLAGFEPVEIDIIANVVRYHRKSLPKRRHESFSSLNAPARMRVKMLGGILRLVAGLDRSHEGVVTDIQCALTHGRLEVKVVARDSAELELWVANRRSDLLEEALGVPVLVCLASAP